MFEVQNYLYQREQIYDSILSFLGCETNEEIKYLIDINNYFVFFNIKNNTNYLKEFILMIAKIAQNHHTTQNFINKIKILLISYIKDLDNSISSFEIFKNFKNNKRLLIFLIQNKIIPINDFINFIAQSEEENFSDFILLLPEINPFIEDEKFNDFKEQFDNQYLMISDDFIEKRQKGENDSYVCELIRNDSIKEFIIYVNKYDIPLTATIKPSIFETNSFLIKNANTTLIQYAAFFGSIQIFNYLQSNNVELTPSLWLYAIHSNNAEMIELLEENNVKPPNNSYEKCFKEAIKCHHNEVANYIKENYSDCNFNNEIEFRFHYNNYASFPNNVDNKKLFLAACKYNNMTLFDLFMKNKINENDDLIIDSALHAAAEKNNQEIIKILLKQSGVEIKSITFQGCNKLTSIRIPSSITSIPHSSFKGCNSLKQVIIPDTVKNIGIRCFDECTSLKEIHLPQSLTMINSFLFNGCSSLENVSIPYNVRTIGNYAFGYCKSLKKIDLPSSITQIQPNAFYQCPSLIDIKLPPNLQKIGSYAFFKCESLKEITIPSLVYKVGAYAFRECSSLSKVIIDSKKVDIEGNAFLLSSSIKEIINCSSLNFCINSSVNLTRI